MRWRKPTSSTPAWQDLFSSPGNQPQRLRHCYTPRLGDLLDIKHLRSCCLPRALEVPPELGLPPNSTESSLFAPEENDGDHLPPRNVATNSPEPVIEPETSARSEREIEAVEEQKGRPQRQAKSTTRLSEY